MKHLKSLIVIVAALVIALPAYALIQARLVNPDGEKVYTLDDKTAFTLEDEVSTVEIVEEVSLGGRAGHIVDVIGSRIGTTTVGVYFSGATSTNPILIGREFDTAVFSIQAIEASTTPSVYFSILASNDRDCDTATTTTSMANIVVTGDINWFDIGSHIRNLTGSTTLNVGTSTINWLANSAGRGTVLALEDLNYRCLSLQVNSTGTNLFIQVEKKTFK